MTLPLSCSARLGCSGLHFATPIDPSKPVRQGMASQFGRTESEEKAMEAPHGEFNFTRLERVLFGPGKVAALPYELDRRGLKRAVVVTGKTLGASQLLAQLTEALGSRC